MDPEENVSRGRAEWREAYLVQRQHKLEQLAEMTRFADGHTCRMLHMVQHFGDLEDSGAACDQCDVCADNCPEDAIHLKDGAFLVDTDACTGCLTCVEVCPHHVMFEQKNSDIPVKCNLCGECAQTCPRNAIVWVEEQESAVA